MEYVNDLTVETVREIFYYNPLTGDLIWTIRPRKNIPIGSKAGRVHKFGYVIVRFQGQDYKAHRLIWLYMTGEWPNDEIDHEDRNRANNIWTNLREATRLQNRYNSVHKNTTTGFKGVTRNGNNKWQARIKNAGKYFCLGTYDTPEKAHQAYIEAANRIAGSYACTETRSE
jgi:hypothetical protein